MKKLLIALPLIALIAAGCNSSQTSQNNNSDSGSNQQQSPSPSAGTPTTPLTPTPGQNPAPQPTAQTKNFSISASNYSFTPNQIAVSKGDKVNVTFKVAQGFHNMTITGYNLATKSISAGQTDTLSFTANQTGTFQFYCSVDGHRELGMVGNLIVR